MNKILVVEDELSIRSFVSLNLKKKGYIVTEAETGEEALRLYHRENFDIILLDLMLPGIDGFEVCQEIRKVNQTVGIIMLTARTQEKDKVEGLIIGADDYLYKPFSIVELEARIFSLLRRLTVDQSISKENDERITSGPFHLDMKTKRLISSGREIKLTPTEFSILHYLMGHPNRVYTRDELLDEIWGKNYVGDLKVVDVNIRRIRQKIETDPSSPVFLCTEWGLGYIWMGNV
ncbi:response regulator transcription factor [Metabacillus halosaccharovorans]|uniref:response regulator transcription factor n=1 Tax=Metabacillus halosaccharovorans TaxID=930124 RepID=UPI001C1F68B1|nr:response regulator transcription factor [Metabacillus halosaccharovorans]MBU7592824.1 response regulator transcription factor [Metabacillus halosaccharovorans]